MVAKIKPLPVKFTPGERSMQNAYAERGWMRHPGTAVGRVPYKSQSGKYLTGLDEDSDKIRQLKRLDPVEGERVSRETKERRERLEAATGLDLGPRSEYYSGVYGIKYGTDEVARKVKLMDRENIFNFNIPQEEITYYWLKEHEYLIAPSLVEWESGKSPHTVQFYVENEAAEAEIVYKKNTSMVDAVSKLTRMNLADRKKVAKLCGISIAENDNELSVYNKLYTLINEGLITNAKYKGQDSINVFNRIANLSAATMNARFLIDQAIDLRIYNKRNGVMYEGENMVSSTEEELVEQLASGTRQQEMLALEIKVNDKQRLRSTIEGNYLPSYQQMPNVTVPAVVQEEKKPNEYIAKLDNLAKARLARKEKAKLKDKGSKKETVKSEILAE